MIEPLFFEPVFKERIWGGQKLSTFGYDIPNEKIGECWTFAAHPNGSSTVKNGIYSGKTLAELWGNNRELFGNIEGDVFPLLTKILDANEDLSVQVHPNDFYAKSNENGELGKTESWYIIDCEEDAELIFGHNAQTKEELEQMIDDGNWQDLLRVVKIKKGDFFYVPCGTVHALRKGTLVLETQQNSDTTYRLYDYDRRDEAGNLRELHLDKSKQVIQVPFQKEELVYHEELLANAKITHFVNNEFFSVDKIEIVGEAILQQNEEFLLCTVIEGMGELIHQDMKYPLKKGSYFMLPFNFGEYKIVGELEIIIAHI